MCFVLIDWFYLSTEGDGTLSSVRTLCTGVYRRKPDETNEWMNERRNGELQDKTKRNLPVYNCTSTHQVCSPSSCASTCWYYAIYNRKRVPALLRNQTRTEWRYLLWFWYTDANIQFAGNIFNTYELYYSFQNIKEFSEILR